MPHNIFIAPLQSVYSDSPFALANIMLHVIKNEWVHIKNNGTVLDAQKYIKEAMQTPWLSVDQGW